jgi:hypothetical protein
MGLSWKERVFMALLGAATISGLTVLILILVQATYVLLPADNKVWSQVPNRGDQAQAGWVVGMLFPMPS